MSLDDLANELYSVPPDRFVDRREALAAAARSGGDRELAAAFNKLKRPTLSA